MNRNWSIAIIVSAVLIAAGLGYVLMPKDQTADNGNQSSSNNSQINNNAVNQPPMPEIKNKLAVLDTSLGKITLEFYPDDAPKTVTNFIGLAEKGYYDGVIFHRVVRDFVVQSGDPTGTGRGGDSFFGGAFEDELNPATQSYKDGYQKGVLAMANRGPNTNTSQFFIMLKNNPLDRLYTIFGRVVEGQDVVDKIGVTPTDPETDRPVAQVTINSVKIIDKN